MFTFIFRFSNINSVLFELLAYIPPTFAAALTKTSALEFSINSLVSLKSKRFVSSRVEQTISVN